MLHCSNTHNIGLRNADVKKNVALQQNILEFFKLLFFMN